MFDFPTWSATADHSAQELARAAGVNITARWDAARATWACEDRWIAAVRTAGMKFVGIKFWDGRDMAWPVLGADSASEHGARIASFLIDRTINFQRFAGLRDEVREIVAERVPGVKFIERQPDAVAWRLGDRVATMAFITQQLPIGDFPAVQFTARTERTEALNFPAEIIATAISEVLTNECAHTNGEQVGDDVNSWPGGYSYDIRCADCGAFLYREQAAELDDDAP
jgi:hypothetical protein